MTIDTKRLRQEAEAARTVGPWPYRVHPQDVLELIDEIERLCTSADDMVVAFGQLQMSLYETEAALTAASAEIETLRKDAQAARLETLTALGEAGELERQLSTANAEIDELRSRLAGAEAANEETSEALVEHSELNGHVDTVEQCRDFLAHEMVDNGDHGGKLQDFVESLRIVIDQLDKQRRSRNWYKVAYSAGKQKLIESAVDKRLAVARAAAREYVAHVYDLGAMADDNDPRAMAIAGPLGEAHADLWLALGLNLDEEHARLQADIKSRCAVCGWPLTESLEEGCIRGNCSYRPRPDSLYAPERAAAESHVVREQGKEKK